MHSANLKLQQPNARAQAKVARARALVCRGLATPLHSSHPLPLIQMAWNEVVTSLWAWKRG